MGLPWHDIDAFFPFLAENKKDPENLTRIVRYLPILKNSLISSLRKAASLTDVSRQILEAQKQILEQIQLNRGTFRGKNLGGEVTDEQWAAIADGSFRDLWIGDYWEIGGVRWRIADMDYWIHTGSADVTDHHLVIVPDKVLYKAPMHQTDTTDGGYMGSSMYTAGLEQAKQQIRAAFPGHVLIHQTILTNGAAGGIPTMTALADSEVDLMTEQMAYGCGIYSPVSSGTVVPENERIEKTQLRLFALRPDLISNRQTFWLRDIVSAKEFASVNFRGSARKYQAASNSGVRPAFAIYQPKAKTEPEGGTKNVT